MQFTKELETFRAQWKKDLRESISKNSSSAINNNDSPSDAINKQEPSKTLNKNELFLSRINGSTRTAMEIYQTAIKNEQEGNLNEALKNYRKAFKLDENVDQIYHIFEQEFGDESLSLCNESRETKEDFSFFKQTQEDYIPLNSTFATDNAGSLSEADSIRCLSKKFASAKLNEEDLNITESNETIEFNPITQGKDCLLNILTTETMVRILKILIVKDVNSLGSFSSTSKKGFLLSYNNEVWDHLAKVLFDKKIRRIYKYEAGYTKWLDPYQGSWRRLIIDRPRVRHDGIYISTCHYIRPGNSDISAHQPVHLVTYYRYLRFYKDGTVLSLLSNEEPKNIVYTVHRNKNETKTKGTMEGTYTLNQKKDRFYIVLEVEDPVNRFGILFKQELNMKSTVRGRHNKLVWQSYSSFDYQSKEWNAYSKKQFFPYFFSRVKSFSHN